MTTPCGAVRNGRPVVAGEATGPALVLQQPLSLAFGMSLETGRVIDIHAPERGMMLAGHVLVMPVGRGSSTASSVLAEAIRLGVAPAAIILGEVDQILALGSIVARTLYDRVCPILVAAPEDLGAIGTGDRVTIWYDGTFSIEPAEATPGVT